MPDHDRERERRSRKDYSERDRRSRSPRRKRDEEERKGDRYRARSRSNSRTRRKPSRSRSPPRKQRRSRSRSKTRRHRDDSHERRPRERSTSRHRKRRQSRSVSSSSSGSSDDTRSRKRKDKHGRVKSRSRSRDRKEKKKGKDKKKEKKKKKKDANKGAVPEMQWGKYGIISESDMYEKDPEFRTWLVEERMINPETMSKDQTKKEFARFVEDYNTATLPHEKFYNMSAYEARMTSMRNGDTLPIVDSYDPNADLVAHSTAHKRVARETETYMSREQLEELRRVQQQRHQVAKMKLMGMEIKQSFGVRMDGNEFEE